TTHRPRASLRQGSDPVVETPSRSRAVVLGGLTRGHRHHIQTRCGGKSAAAAPGAVHLAGPGGPAPDSDDANGPRYGGYRGVLEPPEDSPGGPVPPSVGSTGNERPRLGGWKGRARSTPNGTVHRNLRSREEQEERALSRSL